MSDFSYTTHEAEAEIWEVFREIMLLGLDRAPASRRDRPAFRYLRKVLEEMHQRRAAYDWRVEPLRNELLQDLARALQRASDEENLIVDDLVLAVLARTWLEP